MMGWAIPSRLSIYDRDYDHELGRQLQIALDGQLQHKVIAFDCEAGWVERYKTNSDGRIVVDYTKGEATIERATGRVLVLQVVNQSAGAS